MDKALRAIPDKMIILETLPLIPQRVMFNRNNLLLEICVDHLVVHSSTFATLFEMRHIFVSWIVIWPPVCAR